jgi:hypothetical protein
MKLTDTPGRVYRMGIPVPTARERLERLVTACEPAPMPPMPELSPWPFPVSIDAHGNVTRR